MSEVKIYCLTKTGGKRIDWHSFLKQLLLTFVYNHFQKSLAETSAFLKHPKTQERLFMSGGGAVLHSLNRRCHF